MKAQACKPDLLFLCHRKADSELLLTTSGWTLVFLGDGRSRRRWDQLITTAAAKGIMLRTMSDMLRLGRVRPSLDLTPEARNDMTYSEVMTWRHRIAGSDLMVFEETRSNPQKCVFKYAYSCHLLI